MSTRSLITLAVFIHVIAAVGSTGYYHSDEHFQILEFAGLKLGFNSPTDMPWEYRLEMRPAIQPALAYVLIEFLGSIGLDNPFHSAIILRLCSAAIGLASAWLLYAALVRELRSETLRRWFLALSLTTWFVVYIHIRYSAESWSGAMFFAGLGVYLLAADQHKPQPKLILLAGLLFGLSFAFKAQVGVLLAGFGGWLLAIKRPNVSHLARLGVGFASVVGLSICVDRWFYGHWTLTSWNYLNANIMQHNLARFSQEPWWYYFKAIIEAAIPPYSIVLMLGIAAYCIRYWSSPITFAVIPYLLVHMALGHKELRFLFPLVNAVPTMLVLGLQKFVAPEGQRDIADQLKNRAAWWFVRSFIVLNVCLLTVICLTPARSQTQLLEIIYDRHYRKLYVTGGPDPDIRGCAEQE